MKEKGVSEILGEMLLLVIVVILAAFLSANISNYIPSMKSVPYAIFTGKVNGNNYTIIQEGGYPICVSDMKIVIDNGTIAVLNSTQIYKLLNDVNKNGYWNFGECLNISRSYGNNVTITIVAKGVVICKLFFR